MGPSFPNGSPAEQEKHIPSTFATKTGIRTTLLRFTPFKKALISGIPDPAAAGSRQHKDPDKIEKNKQKNWYEKKAPA
jgi:hypothetical protein